jgi:predicted  nucleic acid-binding Zn-ribbon protein
MTETPKNFLTDLKELSIVDAKLARLKAEKLTLEKEIKEKETFLKNLSEKVSKADHAHQLKEVQYKKEERYIRDEQSKLTDRRKALMTLQSYKLQQAAEKEIEAAAKVLNTQEEALIAVLDELEKLSNQANELKTQYQQKTEELEKFKAEAKDAFAQYAERQAIYDGERAELVKNVGPEILTQYQRVAEKHPNDALVLFKDNSCTGCYMTLGPQTLVEINRSSGLVKCRGCGRILYLEQPQAK